MECGADHIVVRVVPKISKNPMIEPRAWGYPAAARKFLCLIRLTPDRRPCSYLGGPAAPPGRGGFVFRAAPPSAFRAGRTARWASTDGTKRTGLGLRSRRRNCQRNSIHKAPPPTTRLRTATIRISAMPWLSNAIIGDSAGPDASPMKRSPKTIGTPVTWQSDHLTRVAVSVAYAYPRQARPIAAGRCAAPQAAAGPERPASTRAGHSSVAAELTVVRRNGRCLAGHHGLHQSRSRTPPRPNPGSSETGVRSAAPNSRRMFKNVGQVSVDSIVAKRRDRPYRSGRSPDWIKVKNPNAPAATRLIEG